MAVIRETEFGQIVDIYERQAEECVRSVEIFYDEITDLARKTAYHPLIDFTNQIYEFYKGDLREHLQREFDRWYQSDYSLHALMRGIGAGESAIRRAQSYMDDMEGHLMQMFQRGPNRIYVDSTEPEIEDKDFDTFSNAISICVRNCERANQNAISEINRMAAENNAVSCITGFVKTLGVSMTGSFQGMISQVEEGLGLFRTGVNSSLSQAPDVGKEAGMHILWGKGAIFI